MLGNDRVTDSDGGLRAVPRRTPAGSRHHSGTEIARESRPWEKDAAQLSVNLITGEKLRPLNLETGYTSASIVRGKDGRKGEDEGENKK